jgi:hypothetical protein
VIEILIEVGAQLNQADCGEETRHIASCYGHVKVYESGGVAIGARECEPTLKNGGATALRVATRNKQRSISFSLFSFFLIVGESGVLPS